MLQSSAWACIEPEVLWCCRSWQGISHPMNSNPFPASFLNFKGTFKLSRVYIPGNQTFMVSLRALMVVLTSHQVLLPCSHLLQMWTICLAFYTDLKITQTPWVNIR